MIFVTLGSQKFPFDRLLQKLDQMIADGVIADTVLAQTGYCTYTPQHFQAIPFLDRETFASHMAQADLVITHAGTGAIIGGVKNGKKVIAVPRLAKYGEHVDDHQLQIVKQFAQMDLIEPCYQVDDLPQAYHTALQKHYQPYQSNTATIIQSIQEYLEAL